jgi:hypothetical protein
MITRKEASSILFNYGLKNRYSLRTIGFSDLARTSAQLVSIEDSVLSPMTNEILQELKKEFAPLGVIVEVKGWPSASWC